MQSNNFLCDFDKVTWYENIPKGSVYEALMEAIYLKDLEAVREAATKVPDINHITNFFEDFSLNFRAKYNEHKFCYEPTTPLLFALKVDSMEIIKCLVEEFGADVNFYDEKKISIESPLSYLIPLQCSKERISYLVSKGADINDIHCGKDIYTGLTLMLHSSLQIFWWHGHLARLDYIRFLKSQGADFNKRMRRYFINAKGEVLEVLPSGVKLSMTPLEIVVYEAKHHFGDLGGEIFDLLVELGSDPTNMTRPEAKPIPDYWQKVYGDYPKQKPEEIEASVFNNYGISFEII